jgi:hypothetical protein
MTLVCTECGGVSHRPSGFVEARASFMCDHCRTLQRIAPGEARAPESPDPRRPSRNA